MPREDHVELEGVITEACGGGIYRIVVDKAKPDSPTTEVLARLNGRMKRHHIRVIPGDRVRVGVSPYDLTHGLIVFRSKG